jgi:methionyl-tRNA formyltransferase
MNNSLRIVFMGTPEFAVASLDALVNSRHKVIAVVTAPDRPASRGLKLQQSAVKEYAVKNNLKVLQPEKLKDESFINQLKELNPDLIVVVAFRMLPEVVWKMPKIGTINMHASILPDYRGAAPINWAIINGEKQTGLTVFYINEDIDKGNILRWKDVSIEENDNAGALHDNLMKEGREFLVETIDAIADGNYSKGTPQGKVENDLQHPLKLAPKIFKQDCLINWNKPAEQVRNFIRGLSPYPTAWTVFQNKEGKKLTLKIYASIVKPDVILPPGKITVKDSIHIYIGCSDTALEITELQLEGRKTMPVADFLRGFRLEEEGWDIVN